MKISWKHAFYVGGFLAGLCGVLGLVIAGGDLLTRDTIAKNKIQKEISSLKKVYGENADYGEAIELSEPQYASLKKYWTVSVNNEVVGRVYSTTNTNSYGTVSLLVGINLDYSYGNVITLENTESYATTLQEEYLDKVEAAEDKDYALTQVKCGATSGAKMCREMIESAKQHYQGGKNG